MLDPSDCIVWIGIRSKNVIQFAQSVFSCISNQCCSEADDNEVSNKQLKFCYFSIELSPSLDSGKRYKYQL